MIKVTIDTILKSVGALKDLSDKDISINISIKLVKALKELNTVIEVFEQSRNGLFKKYGGEENDDGTITILEEHSKTFNQEYNNLTKEIVEVDFDKFDIEVFGEVNIKTSTLLLLDWLIEI